jgi:DNA modification methylase
MSQDNTHAQSQVRTNEHPGLDRRKVDPHRLVKSRLIEDNSDSPRSHLKESIEDTGVLLPVLARKEDGQWAVFEGWDRVRKARDVGTEVPIWVPEDGQWTDDKARRARLFANTAANQNQVDWLRRAWLLEDAWEELGDTVGLSPSGIADLVNVPEPTARHWIEPVRDTWDGTIIDRNSYENGQIREDYGNDSYSIGNVNIRDVAANLGTQRLIDIRTRSKTEDEIHRLLLRFVNDKVDPAEFDQAKELADEEGIPLLTALNDVEADQDQQINTTVIGETASQISSVAAEMDIDESEFVEEAVEQRIEHTDALIETRSEEPDSGHPDQQTHLDTKVDGPRPEPRLCMESNTKTAEEPAETVHLTVTSPPYNVGWEYGPDQDDKMNYTTEYLPMLVETFEEVYRLTVSGGFLCVVVPFIIDVETDEMETPEGTFMAADIAEVLTTQGDWRLHECVIWYKGYHEAGLREQPNWPHPLRRNLNNFIETVVVLEKPGFRIPSDEQETQSRIIWDNDVEDRDLRENLWRISPEVWEPQYTETNDTAQFPEKLAKRCILHWSYVGDTVLDPFCGRGTTLKMAKRLYRESVGYEIQEELERDIREYVGMD